MFFYKTHPTFLTSLIQRLGFILIVQCILTPAFATAEREKRFAGAGAKIPLSEYPWVVKISQYATAPGFECSGSLVAPDLVLTAAHCIYNCKNRACIQVTLMNIPIPVTDEITDERYAEIYDKLRRTASKAYILSGYSEVESPFDTRTKPNQTAINTENVSNHTENISNHTKNILNQFFVGTTAYIVHHDIAFIVLDKPIDIEKLGITLPQLPSKGLTCDELKHKKFTALGYAGNIALTGTNTSLSDYSITCELTPCLHSDDQDSPILFYATNHRIATEHGDSGGPVFYQNGNETIIAGVLVSLMSHTTAQEGSGEPDLLFPFTPNLLFPFIKDIVIDPTLLGQNVSSHWTLVAPVTPLVKQIAEYRQSYSNHIDYTMIVDLPCLVENHEEIIATNKAIAYNRSKIALEYDDLMWQKIKPLEEELDSIDSKMTTASFWHNETEWTRLTKRRENLEAEIYSTLSELDREYENQVKKTGNYESIVVNTCSLQEHDYEQSEELDLDHLHSIVTGFLTDHCPAGARPLSRGEDEDDYDPYTPVYIAAGVISAVLICITVAGLVITKYRKGYYPIPFSH